MPRRLPRSQLAGLGALAAAFAPLATDHRPLTTATAPLHIPDYDADASSPVPPEPLLPNPQPLTPCHGTAVRDGLGRFRPGCPPGPGRPRKPSGGHFLPEGRLYMEIMEQDRATAAWQSICRRNGPDAAAQLLKDLEDAHGRIRFRACALAAIAAARVANRSKPASHNRQKPKRKPK